MALKFSGQVMMVTLLVLWKLVMLPVNNFNLVLYYGEMLDELDIWREDLLLLFEVLTVM
jgi:hypothetical protein